ncbi:subtilisin-like protein [Viridothelium virens]|uniref:Subtilisin-like protein n=1 Tax=Viridothelium virens TaxID=1048519 RepID=A0A6A6HHE2_VIRVR|nr:subtilisin-like protein [Viridothelium virens]
MLFLAFLFLLGACGATEFSDRVQKRTFAPYYDAGENLVPDHYIVRLTQGYTLQQHYGFCGVNLSQTCPGFKAFPSLRSYRAQLDNNTLHVVRTDPGVEYIEHEFYISETDSTNDKDDETYSSHSPVTHTKRRNDAVIREAHWQVLMSTTPRKLDNIDIGATSRVKTVRNPGRGVRAYIFDTGVRTSHGSFDGRAAIFANRNNPYCPGNEGISDMRGHGTSVASVLASGSGVSMSLANILSVKVNCRVPSPAFLMVQAFVDVIAEHEALVNQRPDWFKGSIIVLALGTGSPLSPILRDAVDAANNAGITVVAAAGNNRMRVSDRPGLFCGLNTTICVASCDSSYTLSEFSNFGDDVDIIAPGERIIRASHISDIDYTLVGSGTSLSAPLVASVLSNFIGYEGLITDTSVIRQRLFDNALEGIIDGIDRRTGTPNRLANIPTNSWRYRNRLGGLPYVGAPRNRRIFAGCLQPRTSTKANFTRPAPYNQSREVDCGA